MKMTVKQITKDYLFHLEQVNEAKRMALLKIQEITERHLGETLRFVPVRMYSGVTFDYIRIHKYGYIAWGCETKIDFRLADQTLFETFGPDENDIKEAIILEDWKQGINRRNQE